MSAVRLKKQDMIDDVGSLEGIRDPLRALFTILALSAIGEMNFFGKPETLGWLEEQLIFKHYIAELRLSLEKLQEFVECDGGVPMQVKLFNDMIPALLTLHHGFSQLSK
jgi:hypothetical protein